MLQALAAASGRKFESAPFGTNDFLLTPGRDVERPGRRFAEVFNLGQILSADPDVGLAHQIRQTQVELEIQRKTYGDKHPEVQNLINRSDVLRSQLEQSKRSPKDVETRLRQIDEVVRSTLERLAPGEKPPEFQFHPRSNLLIVIGGEDAIEVTRKVIAALERNPG